MEKDRFNVSDLHTFPDRIRRNDLAVGAVSNIYPDYSTYRHAVSEDVLLFPRFQRVTVLGRVYRYRSVRSIAKVATKYAKRMADAPATPPEDIACLIAVYNRLKTFRLFPLSCSSDSLACLFFFADQGCKANFVIGVKENPLTTHAWLEINGAVANDVDAVVFNYTPILQTNNEGHLREASLTGALCKTPASGGPKNGRQPTKRDLDHSHHRVSLRSSFSPTNSPPSPS